MVVGVRVLVLFDLLLGGLPHRPVEVVRVAKLAVLRRLVGCPPAVVRHCEVEKSKTRVRSTSLWRR